MGEVENVVERFNGGLIRRPDSTNARGYVTGYNPVEAMTFALEPLQARNEQLEAQLAEARAGIEKLESQIAADDHSQMIAERFFPR